MSWKAKLLRRSICVLLIPALSLPASGKPSLEPAVASKVVAAGQDSLNTPRNSGTPVPISSAGRLRPAFSVNTGVTVAPSASLVSRGRLQQVTGPAYRFGVRAEGDNEDGKTKKRVVIGLAIIAVAAFFLLSGGGDDSPLTGDLEVSVDVP